jgi:hypothetical protein
MKSTALQKPDVILKPVTGPQMGSRNGETPIGGSGNPILEHPLILKPAIPVSGLKSRIRILPEWEPSALGLTDGKPLGFTRIEKPEGGERKRTKGLLMLFGDSSAGTNQDTTAMGKVGPTRRSFWGFSEVGDKPGRRLFFVGREPGGDGGLSKTQDPDDTVPPGGAPQARIRLPERAGQR